MDTELVNPLLLQPTIDYPYETTRTAADLIITGRRAKYNKCKVILSHAGGTLPYLINRMAVSRPDVKEQFMKDLASFHYDLALSSAPVVMDMLVQLVEEEKLLVGSDYPYAPIAGIRGFAELLGGYKIGRKRREKIYNRNAMKLFPRLAEEWAKAGIN